MASILRSLRAPLKVQWTALVIAIVTLSPQTARSQQATHRAPAAPDAHALIAAAIHTVQGRGSLNALRSLRAVGIQHEFILGNAERADGPWRTAYTKFVELRTLGEDRMRRTDQSVPANGSAGANRVFILTDSVVTLSAGSRQTGLSPGVYEDLVDHLENSPERALLLASVSPRLRWDGLVKRYGLVFDVVSFPWRNGRMRIELRRKYHFPDAIEIVRPYPGNIRWAPFGDVTMRSEYMDWMLQSSGVWWPMQQKVTFNGQPLRDITIAHVTLSTESADPDSFTVSDSARATYAANAKTTFENFRLGMRGQPKELRPGIVRIPDFWAMTVVNQDDGIVIFEAHISAGYLRQVISEAKRRFPGKPVKAIVMTSDPWAHLGGFREAVALGIPIYVTAGSIPFLTSVAKAPHTLAPDSLQRAPRAPKFTAVAGKTTIGYGLNRIELYPVGGEYGERMLMAYFPSHRLLYGADLVDPNNGPDENRTPAVDLLNAVTRAGLQVDSVFCVQNQDPIAWQDLVKKAQ